MKDNKLNALFEKNNVIQEVNQKNTERYIIPTGYIALDYGILGIGGFPTGHMVEIFGKEGCGKTTMAMHIALNVQKMGGMVFLADTERWDLDRATKMGIDLSKEHLVRIQGATLEEIFSNIYTAVEAYKQFKITTPTVVIFDSIALTPSKFELEATIKGSSAPVASTARILTSVLKTLEIMLEDLPILIVIINQYRMNLSNLNKPSYLSSWKTMYQTTGGEALKFACHARIELIPKKTFEQGDRVYGHFIQATAIKNKIAPPNIKREYLQFYNGKVGNWHTVITEGTKLGIIQQKGAWYSYKEHKFQGALGILKLDKKVYKELEKDVSMALKNEITEIYETKLL